MKPPRGRALVTGAGKRIGSALAQALGAIGFDVAVHYRDSVQEAEATVANIVANRRRAVAVKADLMNCDQRDRLIGDAAEALGGPVTLLVNSAAAFVADRAQTHDQHLWDLHMGLNLRVPVRLAQLMAAGLADTQTGLIVNIIDHRIWKLNPTYFTYTLAKSALWTATRTLAQALAPGIRVNAIGPGAALPNDQETRSDFDREIAASLMQCWPSPDMLAQALVYLVDAQAVTGQMIAVDGGQHLVWRTPDLPESSRESAVDRVQPSVTVPLELPADGIVPVVHEVIVDRLECEAEIGVNDSEKGCVQTIWVSARIATLVPVGGDSIGDTVDYIAVVEAIGEVVAERRRGLAETLASDIAERLWRIEGVGGVEIRVDKPRALASVLPGVQGLVGAMARIGDMDQGARPVAVMTSNRAGISGKSRR